MMGAANTPNHWPMPPNESGQSGIVSLVNEEVEQMPIRHPFTGSQNGPVNVLNEPAHLCGRHVERLAVGSTQA